MTDAYALLRSSTGTVNGEGAVAPTVASSSAIPVSAATPGSLRVPSTLLQRIAASASTPSWAGVPDTAPVSAPRQLLSCLLVMTPPPARCAEARRTQSVEIAYRPILVAATKMRCGFTMLDVYARAKGPFLSWTEQDQSAWFVTLPHIPVVPPETEEAVPVLGHWPGRVVCCLVHVRKVRLLLLWMRDSIPALSVMLPSLQVLLLVSISVYACRRGLNGTLRGIAAVKGSLWWQDFVIFF